MIGNEDKKKTFNVWKNMERMNSLRAMTNLWFLLLPFHSYLVNHIYTHTRKSLMDPFFSSLSFFGEMPMAFCASYLTHALNANTKTVTTFAYGFLQISKIKEWLILDTIFNDAKPVAR